MNKSMLVGAVLGAVGVTAGGAVATYSLVKGGSEAPVPAQAQVAAPAPAPVPAPVLAPPPVQPQYAQVLGVQPINEQIKTPRQVCKDVQVTHQKPVQDQHQILGSVIGAVAGGLLGHEVGGGTGKKLATVAGAVGGGYAGNKVQEHMQEGDTYTTTESKCNTVNDISNKVVGYDVKYQINGKVGQVRMDRNPGSQIPLNQQGQLMLGQGGPAQQGQANQ